MIFGTAGMFVKHIDLPSGEIALLRGFIGSLFFAFADGGKKRKISFQSTKKNIGVLLFSGGRLRFVKKL